MSSKNIDEVKRSIARNVQDLCVREKTMNANKQIAFTSRKISSMETEKCNEFRKKFKS